LSIVATSSGVDVVCCGDAAGWVMWSIDYFCGSKGLVGGAVSVEYDARASFGMSVWVMCACYEGWTRLEDGVEPLGSLRCGVFTGSRSIVLRVSMHARNWRSESCGPMFESIASIASVFRMCNRVLDGEVLVVVSIVFHLCVPAAHKGAKCLRSVFEY
jgi:hypothetical protein